MASIITFIQTYGYLAVFIGAIFEGESILLLGGLSAYELYLAFPLVILFAVLGAIVGDWGFFFLGRYKKEFIVRRLPKLYHVTQKAHSFIERKPRLSSFATRFMYGFRHIVPVSIGMSHIKTSQFLIWNTFGAILWAFVVTGLGYIAGEALEAVLGNLRHYEFRIILFVVIGISVFSIIGRTARFFLRKKIGAIPYSDDIR